MKYIPIDFDKLSLNIRRARNLKGYTQTELAIISSFGIVTIQNTEKSSKAIKLKTLDSIAKALNLSVENLLKGDIYNGNI